jgi:periplasmic divalent cation tolerance protein
MIFIYVTYPNFKTARKIIRALLEKRLVICANVFPVSSIYRWEGKIEESKETVSILKTTKSNWEKVKREIAKIHPYKIPCIVKIEAEADKKYMNWILKNLCSPNPSFP